MNEPACRRCGYPARELPGLICPECGSDFRETGIRRPGERSSFGIAGPIVAAALLVFMPALVLGMVLGGSVEHLSLQRSTTFWPLDCDRQTDPVESATILLSGEGNQWHFGPLRTQDPYDRITFQIALRGKTAASLAVNRSGLMVQPVGDHPFGASAASACLQSMGLDPQSQRARQLAADLAANVVSFQGGRFNELGFTDLAGEDFSSSGGGQAGIWFYLMPWCAALLLFVWLARAGCKPAPIHGSRCAHCASPVHGVRTLSCPQCGGDLRKVGISVDQRRRFTGLAGSLAPLTTILIVLGALTESTCSAVFVDFDSNQSKAFQQDDFFAEKPIVQRVDIDESRAALQLSDNGPRLFEFSPRITANVRIRGHHPEFITCDRRDRYHYFQPNGQRVDCPLSSESLQSWLKSMGMDANAPITQGLANDLNISLRQTWDGHLDQIKFQRLSPAGSSSTHSLSEADLIENGEWVFWLVIWSGGVWFIFRIGEKQRLAQRQMPVTDIAPSNSPQLPPQLPRV